jgi:hypothetical protein
LLLALATTVISLGSHDHILLSDGFGSLQLTPVKLAYGRSVKLLLAFASTVILGSSFLKIHDQNFYSLLDM